MTERAAIRGALDSVEDSLYRYRHFGAPGDQTDEAVIARLENACDELREALKALDDPSGCRSPPPL